jgi:hypothetical protein
MNCFDNNAAIEPDDARYAAVFGMSSGADGRQGHPGGMQEGSRGLSEAQRATPPVCVVNKLGTPEGCQQWPMNPRVFDPSGVEDFLSRPNRGYRCAQPPATISHPSGMIPVIALNQNLL